MKEKYRVIVGEVGYEVGHILGSSVESLQRARIILGKELAKYHGDGWGRIEINHSFPDPTKWQRIE